MYQMLAVNECTGDGSGLVLLQALRQEISSAPKVNRVIPRPYNIEHATRREDMAIFGERSADNWQMESANQGRNHGCLYERPNVASGDVSVQELDESRTPLQLCKLNF
jgi:hypothetical protein